MNASKTHRALAALLALCISPAPALAQSTSLGIVSAVSGVASVVRAGRQDAQPVQFKDNVFLKDLIRTGDKGLVRLLMGGKAVITVREFTNLTITDDPGRPTVIELTQGKIAVGVARARMKPGESIEIHTPNAIAGVRGTFLVVEVERPRTAQLGGGIAGITTNVHVISGLVNVQAGGQQTNVGGLQTVTATGNNLGQLRTLSANDAANITRTYHPSPQNSAPDQHTNAPPRAAMANLVEGHQQQFEQLARALSGAPELFIPTKNDTTLENDRSGRDLKTDQDLTPTKELIRGSIIGSSPLTFPRGPIDTNERFTSMALRSGEELAGIGIVTIDGPATWTGGTMSGTGTTALNGGTSIAGTDLSLEHGRKVELNGVTLLADTVSISTDTHAKIENHGVIAKTGIGAATIGSGILFDNLGAIHIVDSNGVFELQGSGTHGSTFTGDGTLVFGGGTQTFNSNSTISTANTILNGGGTIAGTGVLTVTGGFDWQDGTMTGPGTTSLQGPTTIIGGGSRHLDLGRTLSLEGATTLDGGITTTVGSGTVRFANGTHTIAQTATISTTNTILSGGTIQGTGLLTVTGAFDWQTGVMRDPGTTQLQGPTTISSPDHKFLTDGRTLLLQGPTSFTGGALALAGGAVVLNNGTLTLADVDLGALDTGTLRNTGTIAKTSGGGTTTIGGLTVGMLTFDNQGIVDVQSGRIEVDGDGTHTGVFNVTTSGALTFAGGTHQMNAGARFTGPGEIEVDGAIVNVALDDIHQAGTLRLSSGTLNVNGTLVSKTAGQSLSPTGPILDVTGGTLSTTGPLVFIGPGGSVGSGPSGYDLVSIGGTATHHVSTAPTASIFDVTGVNTTILNVLGLIVLTLGSDTPLQHDGLLLAKTGSSTLNTNRLLKLDTALFEASKPLMAVYGGGTVNTSNDLVHLASNAKLNGNAGLLPTDALVKLSNATVNVAGSAFNVAGGSHLNVAGNLLYLSNSSTFNIASGSLVTVSNGSVFSLSNGSLASFGGLGTNSLNIASTAALCGGCSITTSILNLAGVPVLLKNGATALNVLVNVGFQPFAGLSGSNTVNVTGASGAVLTVDGVTSKVKLGF